MQMLLKAHISALYGIHFNIIIKQLSNYEDSYVLYLISYLYSVLHVCPVLETKDKPRISYSKIRGYSEVYPWAVLAF